MAQRELSVVVFGASGFTGRRVAGYLAERAAETGLRWAPAGRDPDRVRQALERDGVRGAPEPIAADAGDPASLEEMASRADVVLNMVGPYTRYGEPVIAACIERGAHYADLSGEIPFGREMLDRYGHRARQAGVKVVQACGFECLPADLLTGLARERLLDTAGAEPAAAEVIAGFRPPPGRMRLADGISGGTAQSLAIALSGPSPGLIRDPAALVEAGDFAAKVRASSPIALRPRRLDSAVVAPMQPAAYINPPMIHRSAEVRAREGEASRTAFRYREGVRIGGSPSTVLPRLLGAGAMSGIQAGFAQLTRAPEPVRRQLSALLARVLPKSGAGPDPDRMEGWSWWMEATASGPDGEESMARLDGDGHPGYLASGRMLGEAGMLLSEPGATPDQTGFLTPVTALGTGSAPRFERAGLCFD